MSDKIEFNVSFGNYGQERDRNATESEIKVFDKIQEMVDDELRFVRVSDEYVTAKLGEWDLARIKFTTRAHWVMFPTAEAKQKKHYIDSPDDVADFEDLINKSLEIIHKYS